MLIEHKTDTLSCIPNAKLYIKYVFILAVGILVKWFIFKSLMYGFKNSILLVRVLASYTVWIIVYKDYS